MKRPLRLTLHIAGAFCLACWLLPLAAYGILNMGTLAMLLLGGALVALPWAWRTVLRPFRRLRRLIAATGCAALLFCLVVSALIARRAWLNEPPADAAYPIVVLGSKINGDQPSLMLQRRLHIAATYLATHPDAICVVSGGQGADEAYPEALVMHNYLVRIGVDEGRIRMEGRSTNTRQNLRYSGALLGSDVDTVVIATDSFHQLRASVFARAEGFESYNLSSLTPWGLMPAYWLREILGVSWAWVSIRFGLA